MWHTMSKEEIARKLNTNTKNGLNENEAKKRLNIYGENILKEKKKESFLKKFIKQFNDFMIITLIIAAIISCILSFLNQSNDYLDSIIIVVIVVFNALIGLIQENKAEKSIEALKKLSSPTTKVKRNSKIITIDSKDLVPGDIIILETGALVPADCYLYEAYNLKVEESALTGETVPILKEANIKLKEKIAIGDIKNMVFSSTIITNGHAEAIVVDTGMNTKVGKIADMIISDSAPSTPLQKRLSNVGKILGIFALGICFLIFIIGSFKGISIFEMFMTSVGLAVAAIPEGLPAIVTIMLSIGVTKMARKNAIIRKLPAVETLGSSRVICSDKTGTLTQNKMQIVKVYDAKGTTQEKDTKFILELGCMCTDSYLNSSNGKIDIDGEPTENAIVEAALKYKINKNDLYNKMKRVNEIPFDSNRKLMTTIHKLSNGKYRIITKGAPDTLIKRCSTYYENSSVKSINHTIKDNILKFNETMAKDALRVLAISYYDTPTLPYNITSNEIEKNLTFVGLVGMIDPPRVGVKEAVLTCKKAGIKTVMITGDHILTAKAIATNLGILKKDELAITGDELDKLSDRDLRKNIMKYSVFARVSPEHKVRIVKAFQSTGAVVAMTGDGVNDAPALKIADIGVSMGKNGTDVAKNASDMILTDDNFVTIVEAIKEGRHIYENIKRAIHFLLATNIGEIVTIFVGLLLGLDSPLLAIQLLWINLVTDSFPAIGLGLEKADKHIMDRKPINPKKGIFSNGLLNKIFFEGCMIGILTLISFYIGKTNYSLDVARTMAFASLGMLELFHSLNLRSDNSLFEVGLFKNKYLSLCIAISLILQILVIVITPIANIFNVVPLNSTQWIYVIIISIIPIAIMEIKKKVKELVFGKTIYTLN